MTDIPEDNAPEICGWNLPFCPPPNPFAGRVPPITKRIGKALKRRGFRVAREFCWDDRQENAFVGPGSVDEIVDWLMMKYGITRHNKQIPGSGSVNLRHEGRAIQVQAYGLGGMKKYRNKIIVVLPYIETDLTEWISKL